MSSWVEYLSNNTSWYIVEPWSSSFVQNTSLLHILLRWLISTGWHQNIMFLPWRNCQIHITAKVCCFSFYLSQINSWSLLKSLLLLWWYTILSITFLNSWVFAIVNNDSTYRFSISTSMFPIRWLTIDHWHMETQEEVVRTTFHLFFCPDKQLDRHDVSTTLLLYWIR